MNCALNLSHLSRSNITPRIRSSKPETKDLFKYSSASRNFCSLSLQILTSLILAVKIRQEQKLKTWIALNEKYILDQELYLTEKGTLIIQ
jgi:hypothetical protein